MIIDSELSALTHLTLMFLFFPQCQVVLTGDRIFHFPSLFWVDWDLPFPLNWGAVAISLSVAEKGWAGFHLWGFAGGQDQWKVSQKDTKGRFKLKKKSFWFACRWPWKDPLQMAPLVYGEGLCKVIPAARNNLWEISWLTEQADLQPVGAEEWNSLCGHSWFSVWWGLKPLGHKYPQYAPIKSDSGEGSGSCFRIDAGARGNWLVCADSFGPTWYPIVFMSPIVLKEGETDPAPHKS